MSEELKDISLNFVRNTFYYNYTERKGMKKK